MLTYEDMTGYFLKAASSFEIVTHPEYWVNARSLEREFACTCHMGSCEEAETQSSCTLSFTWSALDTVIVSLIQMLKLRASEQSSRAIETRPGVTLTLHENRLQADTLTLQQRVELPIWHPQGMRGLHDELHYRTDRLAQRRYRAIEEDDEEIDEIVADNPRPEDWLPTVLEDVCQDIMKVLEALDSVRTTGSLN